MQEVQVVRCNSMTKDGTARSRTFKLFSGGDLSQGWEDNGKKKEQHVQNGNEPSHCDYGVQHDVARDIICTT